MPDVLKRDLRLVFRPTGEVDLSTGPRGLETVEGLDNLEQALVMRLLVGQGELAALTHPRYGSRVRELLGEPLDRPNLELLRRHVRKALEQDPRVEEVTQVHVAPRPGEPGVVEVHAVVRAGGGGQVEVRVEVDVG
jgi:phage baseplate assembly protein W